ncbi:calpain-like cysteine peptidase [Trypanosoma conorhini]|uniref:Calpain-like cysteine peptidase n=1 Tax=Trypanosoma conorhini TaxID=83891 RepID=A0A422PQZ0_9TRYP|nr:calpain-like cysteine peptidase [Trypanosoma conorhini]RNF20121.1 calpain-like cysteine peptidase [Trypanosoma conorhini]
MSNYGLRDGNMKTDSFFGTADEFDEGTVADCNTFSEYRYGRPVYEGTSTACFDNGLLYRVIEERHGGRWSFYNDTPNCIMRVEVNFKPGSEVKALGNTSLKKESDGSSVCTVSVHPLETELFIEGSPGGYTSNIKAEGLTDEYLVDLVVEDKETIDKETYDLYQLVGKDASSDEAVKACLANKVKFVDFAFPPEQQSIQIGSLMKMKMIPLERPCMYLSYENAKQVRLFRSGVHPNNIDEGDLGDSWFIGAVAALAEFPDRVRDIFRHPVSIAEGKKERELGIYRVTFNKNGWWLNVIVDDYLPCAGGRPKFARSKHDPMEMWVSILEKAYAKIHGGYGFIIAGDPLHALQDISGYPCSSFNNALAEARVTGGEELFEHFLQYSRLGYLVIFVAPTREALKSAAGGRDESAYEATGLRAGHVYSVLKIVHFPEYNLRLLQFRNPWFNEGDATWSGIWKKGDKKWDEYAEVRAACDYSEGDGSIFYLEWPEAVEYFMGCGVSFIQHPMYDFRIRGCFMQNVPTTCLEISVTTPVILCLLLSQDDMRGTDKREYAPLMISVAHGCGAVTPMRVDLNSGFDTDHPSPEYAFFQTRESSMFYEFVPESSPYLVVPRSMSTYPILPYVLGLRSPIEVGTKNSQVRVLFRALSPSCGVFDNRRNFDASTVPCQAEFQVMDPEQFFPDIYAGTVLQVE